MKSIAFIDSEIEPNSRKVLDIGGIKTDDNTFHKSSLTEFTRFLQGTTFVCGHNILQHDARYVGNAIADAGIETQNIIDTLYVSPLVFPKRPYHALVKDDKLQTEEANNPLNDAIKAKHLFNDEVAAFNLLDDTLKAVFYLLLHEKKEFVGFFNYVAYITTADDILPLIRRYFGYEICEHADLTHLVSTYPVELAYGLSLISVFMADRTTHSITPPWVIRNYPRVESILFLLRNNPCITGCHYCNNALNIYRGLKQFFGFDMYRTYGGEPLQERAVQAAVHNKSILAVFPTGGGKSITFQVPALMSGANANGLTVVISPLQSLMKDQVDNLEKIGITDAVTINGLLDPVERAKSFERVEEGAAKILYISPESLRSHSIERLILGRKIVRFVIDEAHCFSSWGQDFRVDYLFIGDFIKQVQEKKNLDEPIPVSCFTATAKQKVIEDIREYFKQKLSLDLELYTSSAVRTNLQYKVVEKENEEDKYQAARDLIEHKNCPTIIYVSRTKRAYQLAERLSNDGFSAKPYHGKMDKQEKSENQDAFINGEVQIMVATSAFGMGVDKKDVGMVIHYEISDSLENYVQEAGRAGRDENITADCFVLFNEEDLSKHFILLNQTKLSIKEIQQIWKAIKDLTRFRAKVSNSALEIARKAGWDDGVYEIETRVTTAIAALEDSGYLKRGQNMPRIFANSILTKNAQEAIDKINASEKFQGQHKGKAVRIIKKLFSSKSKRQSSEEVAESRVDYISDHLGIVKEEVINIINLLREENILADAKDLSAYIRKGESKRQSLKIVESFRKIEQFLSSVLDEEEKTFVLKDLNEKAELYGCVDVSPNKLKTIINFWAIKNLIKRKNHAYSNNHLAMLTQLSKEKLLEKLEKRHELAQFIIEYLYEKEAEVAAENDKEKEEVLVEFSVHELKAVYDRQQVLIKSRIEIEDIEDALFYLSRIEALKIEGGFLVVYNRITIERLEQDNKRRYRNDDYTKLNEFYNNKVQQIHIVGEYAKKMISDYKDALQFVEDYFQLNYQSFLNKYFKGSRQNEIKRNLTPGKFRQLFGELSPTQLKIINDADSKYIVVAAGPGSGKTRVLVHKLASLLLMEDVKHEQLLMVTFSRAAATEFKKRLLKLIGNAANYIEIKTFHSYCFDLLGKVGSLEKSDAILKKTISRISNGEVEPNRITKTVLVIDEAQDMDADEFALIKLLIERNEDMRVIAVGDDDQNIYEFRGASAKYLEQFIKDNNAAKHELVENFRSKRNLVDFANQFVKRIRHRLKSTEIIAHQNEDGQVKLVRYKSNNLITPLVNDVLRAELTGSTCVLTKTNEEALQVAGLLLKNQLMAKLIQTNDAFSLLNLVEVRFFTRQIDVGDDVFIVSDEIWDNARRQLVNTFRSSSRLELCLTMIEDFEATNPIKKYKSDWEVFVRESRMEDFFSDSIETIFVSTIHKAKGREFDNVFLMMDDFTPTSDADNRQLYVAITRAKRNLTVHTNSGFLENIVVDNMICIKDENIYMPPKEMVIQLTHRDVWLDYFNTRQYAVNSLVCGDELVIRDSECLTEKRQSVIRFSQQFSKVVEGLKLKNYSLKSAKVNFILYWLKEGAKDEVKIVLPELHFEKIQLD